MTSTTKSEHIPRATIQRLAVYVQVLENLLREGVEVISSEPLAKACNVNASQIRKDLAYFGEFGVRGVGYYVKSLIASITSALGVNREWRTVLVGVGNLGRALLNHKEFKLRGFHIVGAFDCDPFKIGERNSRVTLAYLSSNGYNVRRTEVGGNINRTLHVEVSTGTVSMKTPVENAQFALGS